MAQARGEERKALKGGGFKCTLQNVRFQRHLVLKAAFSEIYVLNEFVESFS